MQNNYPGGEKCEKILNTQKKRTHTHTDSHSHIQENFTIFCSIVVITFNV